MGKLHSTLVILLIGFMVMMGVACSSNEPSAPAAQTENNAPAATTENNQAATDTAPAPAAPAADATAAAPAGETGQQEAAQPQAESAEALQSPQVQEITGQIEQTDKGIALIVDGVPYQIVGQDLSPMIGKTVTVTGALEESEGSYSINVLSINEAQ